MAPKGFRCSPDYNTFTSNLHQCSFVQKNELIAVKRYVCGGKHGNDTSFQSPLYLQRNFVHFRRAYYNKNNDIIENGLLWKPPVFGWPHGSRESERERDVWQTAQIRKHDILLLRQWPTQQKWSNIKYIPRPVCTTGKCLEHTQT